MARAAEPERAESGSAARSCYWGMGRRQVQSGLARSRDALVHDGSLVALDRRAVRAAADNRLYTSLYRWMALTDCLCVVAGLLIAYQFRFGQLWPSNDFWLVLAVAPFVTLAFGVGFGLYRSHQYSSLEEFRRIVLSLSMTVTGIVMLSFWSKASFSRLWIGYSWVLALVLAAGLRRLPARARPHRGAARADPRDRRQLRVRGRDRRAGGRRQARPEGQAAGRDRDPGDRQRAGDAGHHAGDAPLGRRADDPVDQRGAAHPRAGRRQAHLRPGGVVDRAAAGLARPAGRGRGDQAGGWRPGAVPAGAGGHAPPALHGAQVPHHGPRGRAPARRPGGPHRGGRAPVQAARGPPDHPGGTPAAPLQPGRAPAALQRAQGRDEPGWAEAAAADRGRQVRGLAARPPRGASGHHRALAGQRPQRAVLR